MWSWGSGFLLAGPTVYRGAIPGNRTTTLDLTRGRALDTNVVSEMMRPAPEPRVIAFLDRIAGDGVGLSSVTVWEILNGVGRLDTGRRRDDILQRFQGLLDDVFEDRVLDWTMADARACAGIMEAKRRRGESLDDHLPDAFLAAAALSRGLSIVTRNARQFRNVGAKVVDPWTSVYQ